jgi:hypothetical protein
MGTSENFSDSPSNPPPSDENAFAFTTEEMPVKPQGIMVHQIVHWIMEGCEHRVTCGCTHLVGQVAYCVMCGEFKPIIDVETEIIYAK